MSAFPILKTYKEQFPHCSETLDALDRFFNGKLWNELSMSILEFIYDPKVKGKITFDFYDTFVRKFERNIDPINLLKIVKQCIINIKDDEALDFLTTFEQKQAFTQQTKTIVQALKGNILVRHDIDKCSALMSKIGSFLENRKDVDSFLYSSYYKFGMNFYQAKNKHKLFYTNALQFMAYTPEREIDHEEKINMLVEMAISVIISKEIYNFSELLEQPLLLTLKKSEHSWIYELLEIFNKGDIVSYQKVIKDVAAKNEHIRKSTSQLEKKIRLMAFLQLAFNLPKNDRVVKFNIIARKCGIPDEHVELMIMKAMALNLVKGSIDQIDQQVIITWVAPKVLGKDKLKVMLSKFDQWTKGLEKMQTFISDSRKISV